MPAPTVQRGHQPRRFSSLRPIWIVGLFFGLLLGSDAKAQPPTFDELVAAERAVQQVYWHHRTWPTENPTGRPPFDQAIPLATVQQRVDDGLRKARALEDLGGRPVSDAEIQAELNRIARDTKNPAVLRELFAALNNDPGLIAETLVRRALVDRRLRSLHGTDARFQGDLGKRVRGLLRSVHSPADLKSLDGKYAEFAIRPEGESTSTSLQDSAGASPAVLFVPPAAWAGLLGQPVVRQASGDLRNRDSGFTRPRIEETEEAFTATILVRQSATEMVIATSRWDKVSFDTWWTSVRANFSPAEAFQSAGVALPEVSSTPCPEDSWEPTAQDVPDRRLDHKAIWTGSEMIIWGGDDLRLNTPYPLSYLSSPTGSRYDPSTDTWTPVNIGSQSPGWRSGFSLIWTGTEAIVWGGAVRGLFFPELNDGGKYNPATNTWTPMVPGPSTPAGRIDHTAVWTGTEMIVWGGYSNSIQGPALQSGGRYNPLTDSWSPLSEGASCPSGRRNHTAVWTGTQMLVWGGEQPYGVPVQTGGVYDLSSDSWTAVPVSPNSPSPRFFHTAVWTGSEMVIWGGLADDTGNAPLGDGAAYSPANSSWRSLPASPTSARFGHTAIWTGSEMIVWGGEAGGDQFADDGARYNPVGDLWTEVLSQPETPPARTRHTAVWTGTEMIVWGGLDGLPIGTGGRYDPIADAWAPVSTGGATPDMRADHVAVWTGSEMIVWGGWDYITLYSSGGRYDPALDRWTPTSTGAWSPGGRLGMKTVWTGDRMIIWGGIDYQAVHGDGGLYDPVTDSWTAVSLVNPPFARYHHSAVWTGTEMIVWGGFGSTDFRSNASILGDGGRYRPDIDQWSPMSHAFDPSPRLRHSSVWTGSEMILWGGAINVFDTFYSPTGGRYVPATDSWLPLSTTFQNTPEYQFPSVIWTGTEVLVWGTYDVARGSRYDPVMDLWSDMDQTQQPRGRVYHSALWTESQMLIWGGGDGTNYSSGGGYFPSTDTWRPFAFGPNSPLLRYAHTGVWTGDRMIVWGGYPTNSTGGVYCPALCTPARWYADADGDGFINSASVTVSCDPQPGLFPPGPDECDDTNPLVYPGAPDLICDGVDNDCSGRSDDQSDIDLDGTGDLCDFTLLSPANGTQFRESDPPPTFTWAPGAFTAWRVEISRQNPHFYSELFSRSKKPGKTLSFTPSKKFWKKVKKLAAGGKPVYWIVAGFSPTGQPPPKYASDQIYSFTIVP